MPEIRNPNLNGHGSGGGGGSDMRSTMIFWLILLLIFFAYESFSNKPKPRAPESSQTRQAAKPAAPSQPSAVVPAAGEAAHAAAANTAAREGKRSAAAPAPEISASSVETTTVENELCKITFTNHGGEIEHWILKKYDGDNHKPLDMVQQQTSARFGFPLELFTYDSALSKELNSADYQVTVSGSKTRNGTVLAPATVTYRYAAHGLDVTKTIHIGSNYVLGVDVKATQNGAPLRALVEWPAGLGDMAEFSPGGLTQSSVRTSATSQVVWSVDGKQHTIAAKKVSGGSTYTDAYSYAGIMDTYFAAAFLPSNPDQATAVTLHNSIELTGNDGKKSPADVIGIAVGSSTGDTKMRLFAGPKATDLLASIHSTGAGGKPDGPSLTPLIKYGWSAIFAKPLYWILRFMVEHGTPNWGWNIILFTVIFTLALLPTRIAMTKSSLKMMRVQPKVDAIKARYKNMKATDPRRAEMNQEMMALYKTENVNMYGSCLPMLVQAPLFYAFYAMLENAIELRQAHWLWLPDLSQADPTHILPILIIVTMFVTQYITPSPGMDPSQRRMMAFFMPVLFGFMLWHYASGLALYWVTSNFIYLAMQIGINRSHWGKEMHAIAARRAAKKAGNKAGNAAAKAIQGRR